MFTAVNSKEALAILPVAAAVHSCELCQFQFATVGFHKLSQASAQGVTGEQFQALGLWQVGTNAGVQHGLLNQTGDVFVRLPIASGLAIITTDPLEQGAKVDLGIMQVLLKRMHRACGVRRATANLNFAPAGFAREGQDGTCVLNCNPALAVLGIVTGKVQADDFRAPQTTCISDQKNSAIPHIAQAIIQRLDHIEDVVAQDRFFLQGRARMFAPDACQHGGDMAILAIKRKAALLVMPCKAREATLDGGDSQWFRWWGRGGTLRDIQADQFGGGRQRFRAPSSAPTAKMRPVGLVSCIGVFSRGEAGVIFGGVDKPVQCAGANDG